MKLYVMRHGPAEDFAVSRRDFDRALTASGRDRVRSVARLLVESDEAPLEIMSSPLVRALETAEIVATAASLAERGGAVVIRKELAPGGDIAGLARELAREKRRRVLITGHEPDLSLFVEEVADHPLRSGFEKAMVVGLSFHPDTPPERAKVRFVLNPKTLHLARS